MSTPKKPVKISRQASRKWLLPLSIGMSLPVIALLVFLLQSRPDESDLYTRGARNIGVSRADYVEAFAIQNKADEKGEISDAEWKVVQKNLTGKQKVRSIETLGFLGKSKHRNEAINLVRARLTSADPDEQGPALGSWFFLNMPDWKAQCEARLNHPNSKRLCRNQGNCAKLQE